MTPQQNNTYAICRFNRTKLCEIFPNVNNVDAANRLTNLYDRYLKSLHLSLERDDNTGVRAAIALLCELSQLIEFEEMFVLSSQLENAAFEKSWLQCKIILEAMKQAIDTIPQTAVN
jgi:hypothetical protein